MQLEAIKNIIFRTFNNVIIKILHINNISFTNPVIVLVCDSLIASISLIISIQLRVGIDYFYSSYILLFNNIFVFGLVNSSVFVWLKVNNQSLGYINKLLLAVLLSNTVFIPLMYLMNFNSNLPFSLLIINVFVMSFLLVGFRYIYYIFFGTKSYTLLVCDNESIIIFLNLYEEIIVNNLKYIGIINANPNINITSEIDIPVIGNINDLQNIIKLINVNQVIIIDDIVSDENKNSLFALSRQYKFLLLQLCMNLSKS